jgi:putative ABC transport system permease protein
MFKNYITIAYRNLIRYKGYTIINVLGLAIGIASCLFIFLFITDELSYDKHNSKADRIYRVAVDGIIGKSAIHQTYTCAPLASTLKKEYPEVEETARIMNFGKPIINYNKKYFSEFAVLAVDSTIFNVFDLPFITGSKNNALNEPNTVVITESTAKKIFGSENPVNKIIKASDGEEFRITAVLKDINKNSHFHFDALISLSSFDFSNDNNWWNNNFSTYVLLRKYINSQTFEKKFTALLHKYLEIPNGTWDSFEKGGDKWSYYLQPLTQIHLKSDLNGEFESNSNIIYIYIFSFVAIFILIIACINFTNLTTAKASTRFKEVGVKKVVGARRHQLFLQFLTESIIITSIAIVLSVIFVELFLGWFNNLAHKEITVNYFSNWWTIPALALFSLIVGCFSGTYPAIFMSSFYPLDLLKNMKIKKTKGKSIREVLVVFQFFISICLIIGTIVVYKQLQYFQNKKLGFDKDNIIIIHRARELGSNVMFFKESILLNSNIKDCSISNTIPGYSFMNWACKVEGFESSEWTTLNMNIVDYDYLKTYNMNMLMGHFFSNEYLTDSTGIILNESAVKALGIHSPIGKKIVFGDKDEYKIIGIINDYHYESLHQKIRPAAIMAFPGIWGANALYVSVKINNKNIKNSIDFLKKTWDEQVTGVPFQYSILTDDYGRLYENEQRTGKVFVVFSILSIFIACLGLFGLSLFIAEQKTKEIGVRKAVGASTLEMVVYLNKIFIKDIVIAFVLACPLVYYLMTKWLQNFAYKTQISWWIFILAGIIALFIALMAVSWQAWRAASKNPVEALRYE